MDKKNATSGFIRLMKIVLTCFVLFSGVIFFSADVEAANQFITSKCTTTFDGTGDVVLYWNPCGKKEIFFSHPYNDWPPICELEINDDDGYYINQIGFVKSIDYQNGKMVLDFKSFFNKNPKFYIGDQYCLEHDCYEDNDYSKVQKFTLSMGKGYPYGAVGHMNLDYVHLGSVEITIDLRNIKFSFDANGGTASSTTKYYTFQNKVSNLPTATRKGYTFLGWFTKATDGTQLKNGDIVKTCNNPKKYYAHWRKNKYTIAFNGNGATSGSMSNKSCTYGTTYTLTANAFKRTHYTFAGWNTKADGSGTAYANSASVKNLTSTDGKTVTLYAQWKINKYTVVFDPNGGSGTMTNPTPYKYGTSYTLPANVFKKTGYTFTGWNTASDSSGKAYADGETVKNLTTVNGKTVTLYAQWRKNKYTITFNGNGATSGSMSNKSCTYGTTYTLPANAFKRTGYTFTGWNTKADGSGTAYANSASVKNLTSVDGKTVTLYARWKVNKYTIAFDGNKASSGTMSPIPCTYGKSTVLPIHGFKRTGYDFKEWNTEPDGSGKVYADGATVKNLTSANGKTVTLYARWKLKKYKITYNLNGGVNSVDNPATFTKNSEITFAKPTKTGYRFLGWYTTSTFTSTTKITGIPSGTMKNITVYAKWTPIIYTVEYYPNGAINGSMSPDTMTYDMSMNLKKCAFSRPGYDFLGWSKSEGGDVIYTNQESVMNLSSKNNAVVKLYAVWKSRTDDRSIAITNPDGAKDGEVLRVFYSDKLFDGYNDEKAAMGGLAQLSASAALSTYGFSGTKAMKLLKDCGFTNVQHHTTVYGDGNSTRSDRDNANVYLGTKSLYDGKTLIAVLINGYTDGGYEWISNFELGTGQYHQGFDIASDKVVSVVNKYISGMDKYNLKFWITGHSRGAAMTNLLSIKLIDNEGININQIYAYGFATPQYTRITGGNYSTILNYINVDDFVPYVAPSAWGYRRFGVDRFLKDNVRGEGIVRYDKHSGNHLYYGRTEIREGLVNAFVDLGGSVEEYPCAKPWEKSTTGEIIPGNLIFSAQDYAQNGLGLFMTNDMMEGAANMCLYSAESEKAAKLTNLLVLENLDIPLVNQLVEFPTYIQDTHNMLLYYSMIEAMYPIPGESIELF